MVLAVVQIAIAALSVGLLLYVTAIVREFRAELRSLRAEHTKHHEHAQHAARAAALRDKRLYAAASVAALETKRLRTTVRDEERSTRAAISLKHGSLDVLCRMLRVLLFQMHHVENERRTAHVARRFELVDADNDPPPSSRPRVA